MAYVDMAYEVKGHVGMASVLMAYVVKLCAYVRVFAARMCLQDSAPM